MKNKKTTKIGHYERRQPAEQKPQKAPHAQPRRNPAPVQEPVRVAPEVVYLAPKPFSRSRLLLHLATIVAVVLALLLGLSIFFKVENIEVSGCSQYTPWQVQQASGIEKGNQLLTFSVPKAAALIRNELPYVKTVRIGVRLPDTVKIEIVETRVTYAVADQSGVLWLMDSDGKIVEQAGNNKTNQTAVSGVTITTPTIGAVAVAYEAPAATGTQEESIPVTVTSAQKLAVVLEIAANLERNGIIGQIASLDVNNLFDIQLWYEDRFHVLLGDTKDLADKISCLKGVVDDYTENRPYESGLLDISNPQRIEYESFGSNEE